MGDCWLVCGAVTVLGMRKNSEKGSVGWLKLLLRLEQENIAQTKDAAKRGLRVGLGGFLSANPGVVTGRVAAELVGAGVAVKDRKGFSGEALEVLFDALSDEEFERLVVGCPSSVAAWQVLGSAVATARLPGSVREDLVRHPSVRVRVMVASHPGFGRGDRLKALAGDCSRSPVSALGRRLGAGSGPAVPRFGLSVGVLSADHHRSRMEKVWGEMFDGLGPWTDADVVRVAAGLDTKVLGPRFLEWLYRTRGPDLGWVFPHLPWVGSADGRFYVTEEGLDLPATVVWELSSWWLPALDGKRFPGMATDRVSVDSVLGELFRCRDTRVLDALRFDELDVMTAGVPSDWDRVFGLGEALVLWCRKYPHLSRSRRFRKAVLRVWDDRAISAYPGRVRYRVPALREVPGLVILLRDVAPVGELFWAVPDLVVEYVQVRRPDVPLTVLAQAVETQPEVTLAELLAVL